MAAKALKSDQSLEWHATFFEYKNVFVFVELTLLYECLTTYMTQYL